MQIIKSNNPLLINDDWNSRSLRKCLIALGLTDLEMRYQKGARRILDSWTGEVESLLELVKKKWKQQVIKYHEATGGDIEKWKIVNTIYSAAIKKISPYLSKVRAKKNKTITFTCSICGEEKTKKLVSHFQYKSSICNNPECQKTYRRNKSRRQRALAKTNYRRICKNERCGKEFFTTNFNKIYCCHKCFIATYTRKHRQKKDWNAFWNKLTEEQRTNYHRKRAERKQKRIENETPEQRSVRLEKIRIKMQVYREKRKLQGNPIKSKYVSLKDWLEKKQKECSNKPWIFETILLKKKHQMSKELKELYKII